MITVEHLRLLGYQIEIHSETNTGSIHGFGIATMFDPSNQEHIDSFFDGHKARADDYSKQIREHIPGR